VADQLIVAPTQGDIVKDGDRTEMIQSVQHYLPASNMWRVTIRDRGRRVKYRAHGETYIWLTTDG
jgi:hypothetical protein